MSPEAQRIAIAEVCGRKPFIKEWGCFHPTEDAICMSSESKNECFEWLERLPADSWAKNYQVRPIYSRPPDYPNDLNAIHVAEMAALSGKCGLFDEGVYKEHLEMIEGHCGRTIFATAAQRSEAFLKTLGLWKDASDMKEVNQGIFGES